MENELAYILLQFSFIAWLWVIFIIAILKWIKRK